MRKTLENMVYKYFVEIVNSGDRDPEVLRGYAENFVDEVARTLSARRDFKED